MSLPEIPVLLSNKSPALKMKHGRAVSGDGVLEKTCQKAKNVKKQEQPHE